jgi:hypothetical protein
MNNDLTKHLSFIYMVPVDFFSPAVRVVKQYGINVRYTLDWRGVVTLDDYNVVPGMAKHIVNWEGLESEMLKAAENNSKQYRKPGQLQGRKMRPEGADSYQDIHDQWKHEVKELH